MSGVVSVGAAVGAVGMAVATESTFAIIGAVGAVAGAVGKITGVKELAIGGAALGAVGGIGAIADSAGMFGAGGLFGGAGDAASGVTAAAGPAGGYSASIGADGMGTLSEAGAGGSFSNVGDLISGKGLSNDVLSSITNTKAPTDVLPYPVDRAGNIIPQGGGEGTSLGNVVNPGAPTSPGGLIDKQGAAPATPVPGPATTTPAVTADTSGNPPVSAGPYQATMPAGTDIPITTLKPGQTAPTTAAPTGDDSTWGSILKFMKENPALTMGGVMAASSFLSGAFNPKTPAEVNALTASAAQNTAQAGLINRQVANMGQPLPGATRTRTNTGIGRVDRMQT